MTRGRRRGRGGRNVVRRVERAVKRDYMEWRTFTPPLQPPTVNSNFTFNFRTSTTYIVSGTSAIDVHVEDAIISICQTVAMTSSWYPLIGVRIMALSVYSVMSDPSAPIPGHTQVVFDPTTTINSQVKAMTVSGDINDPARTGISYPCAINQHVFQWDGVSKTSPKVAGIRWTNKCHGTVYWDLVVSIDKAFAPTFVQSIGVQKVRDNLENFSFLDGPEA